MGVGSISLSGQPMSHGQRRESMAAPWVFTVPHAPPWEPLRIAKGVGAVESGVGMGHQHSLLRNQAGPHSWVQAMAGRPGSGVEVHYCATPCWVNFGLDLILGVGVKPLVCCCCGGVVWRCVVPPGGGPALQWARACAGAEEERGGQGGAVQGHPEASAHALQGGWGPVGVCSTCMRSLVMVAHTHACCFKHAHHQHGHGARGLTQGGMCPVLGSRTLGAGAAPASVPTPLLPSDCPHPCLRPHSLTLVHRTRTPPP